MNEKARYNPYFAKVKKFRLIIGGVYYFRLTKKNYRSIIANDGLRYRITVILADMENGGFFGAVRDDLQIDRIED